MYISSFHSIFYPRTCKFRTLWDNHPCFYPPIFHTDRDMTTQKKNTLDLPALSLNYPSWGDQTSKSHVFSPKNTINLECNHQKSTDPSPSPPTKNQNPCLTNKIRTTKNPSSLYIYIYISSLCPEESTSSCRPFRMVPALRAARRTYRRRRPRPRHRRRCHRRSRPPPPPPAVRRRPVPRGRSQRGRQEFFWGGWEFRWCRVVLG